MSESYDLGLQGEALACRHLESEGCRIIETRWRLNHLELDIIATDGKSLIVAEVKTRRTATWGDPMEAITYRKIMNIVRAANAYFKLNNITQPYRFDVFGIVIPRKGEPSVSHIADAFYPPLG